MMGNGECGRDPDSEFDGSKVEAFVGDLVLRI